jgi:uncharacterized protein (DUF1330 family)
MALSGPRQWSSTGSVWQRVVSNAVTLAAEYKDSGGSNIFQVARVFRCPKPMPSSRIAQFPTAKLAGPAVQSFGGRFLARGNAVIAREQGVKERTVVVEYASLEKATAAYDSPAYAEALKALGDGAVRDFRIVEGAE